MGKQQTSHQRSVLATAQQGQKLEITSTENVKQCKRGEVSKKLKHVTSFIRPVLLQSATIWGADDQMDFDLNWFQRWDVSSCSHVFKKDCQHGCQKHRSNRSKQLRAAKTEWKGRTSSTSCWFQIRDELFPYLTNIFSVTTAIKWTTFNTVNRKREQLMFSQSYQLIDRSKRDWHHRVVIWTSDGPIWPPYRENIRCRVYLYLSLKALWRTAVSSFCMRHHMVALEWPRSPGEGRHHTWIWR